MKLKTLLNTTTATKINITLSEEKGFFTYQVDYLRDGLDPKKYESFEIHTSKATLPKELLQKIVENVDVNLASKALEIRVK